MQMVAVAVGALGVAVAAYGVVGFEPYVGFGTALTVFGAILALVGRRAV